MHSRSPPPRHCPKFLIDGCANGISRLWRRRKGDFVKKTLVVALLLVAVAIPSANAAPSLSCFQTFLTDMEYCSGLPNWWQRSACGADAELSLASCVGNALNPWKK